MTPKNSQNTPKKSQKRIPINIATEAKAKFLQGMSIAEICRLFPLFTYEQFRFLRETEHWDVLKQNLELELTQSLYEDCKETQAKVKRSIIHLANQAFDNVIHSKLKVDSVRDLRLLCEMVGLLHDKKKEVSKPKEYSSEEIDRVLSAILVAKGIPDSPVEDGEN